MYFKDEPPRSRIFYNSTFMPTELGPHFPIFDTKSIELANLFAQEEELAAKIKNDDQMVDKDIIFQAVVMARKIARAGYATTLVDIDEFLDIAQIFSADDPHAARVFQEILMKKNGQSLPEDPDTRLKVARSLFNNQLDIPKKTRRCKGSQTPRKFTCQSHGP